MIKKSTCQCRRHTFDPWSRKIPWWRKWQPTSIFLPEKSQGQRCLAGYRLWGHKESDTILWLNGNNCCYDPGQVFIGCFLFYKKGIVAGIDALEEAWKSMSHTTANLSNCYYFLIIHGKNWKKVKTFFLHIQKNRIQKEIISSYFFYSLLTGPNQYLLICINSITEVFLEHFLCVQIWINNCQII